MKSVNNNADNCCKNVILDNNSICTHGVHLFKIIKLQDHIKEITNYNIEKMQCNGLFSSFTLQDYSQ